MVLIRFWIKQGKVSYNVLFMKNYNFVRFYFGKERWHLQSEVKRNYVMALKVAPKNKLLTSSTIPYLPKTRLGSLLITSKLPLMYMCTYFHESGHFRSLGISDYQNIPLSYKIRLNQVRPANKIHPYNHFSEYFLYFCRYIV